MKRKIIYAVIGVFVIGVIGSVAFVKQAEGQRAKRRGMRDGMAALELTDEQKKKMSDLRSAHQKAMIDLRAAHAKTRIDLGVIRKQDSPSASDIQAKIDVMMAAQGKIMAREIQNSMDVRNLLTAEQKEKLSGMRGKRGGARDFVGAVDRVSRGVVVLAFEAVAGLGSEITMVRGSGDAVVSAVAEVEITIGLKRNLRRRKSLR